MSLEFYLISCLVGTLFIHFLFLVLYIYPLSRQTPSDKTPTHKFPSDIHIAIIVAARNEGHRIHRLLNGLIQQSYPTYSVHIVDDHSTDNTAETVQAFQARHKFIHYHKNLLAQGKKYALRHAIESIDAPILLFTDADCTPASEHWIQSMWTHLGDKDICLGYGKYHEKPGFLNKFIQFETALIASQYLAFAHRHKAYMGVGRNLMYRRELFMRSDRFESHKHLRSGDDDLFISQYTTDNNTAINLHQDSFTISDPPMTWAVLWRQKRRHLTTSVKYPLGIQLRLTAISLSNMYFYFIAIAICIFFPQNCVLMLGSIAGKLLIDMLFYRKLFRQLQISDIFHLFPVLDIILSIYYFILAPFIIFRKTDSW